MANKCDSCAEKCPQAERTHQAALGRMYATKEFVELLKKVESGELVEVVRCKDCKHCRVVNGQCFYAYCEKTNYFFEPFQTDTRAHFCSYGERRDVK